MTQAEAVLYWLNSADRNLKVAQDLFKTGHYDWCLFMWHLVVEKSLKAVVSNRGEVPLPTHNLVKLVEQSGLVMNQSALDELKQITTFNLETRYDDYKFAFFKKADKAFAQKWVKICRSFYQKFLDQCHQE